MSRRTAVIALVVILVLVGYLAFRETRTVSIAPPAPSPEPGEEPAPVPTVEPAPEPIPDPVPSAEPVAAEGPENGAKPKRSLTGRVLGIDGSPVAGATVALFTRYDDIFRTAVRPIRGVDSRQVRVRTGKDGTYTFGPLSPGELGRSYWSADMRVRAEAEGVASYFVSVALHPSRLSAPDLVLRPAFSPEGTVVDGQGQPVAGARVALNFMHSLGPRGAGGEQYLTLADKSDGEGRVRFSAMVRREDWRVSLTVEHRDHLKLEDRRSVADVADGEPFRIVLKTGLIVRGVLLLADGAPAEGYDVHVGRKGRNLSLYSVAKTGKDGAFVVRGVPLRRGAVGFEKGWNDLKHMVDVPEGAEGEAVDLGTIHLPGGATVTGVVHGEDGKPVRCYVNMRSTGEYTGYMNPRWDAKPGYTFTKVPPGEYVISASLDLKDGDEIQGEVSGVKPGDEDVVVTLTRARSILFVFHAADRPDEPFEISSPEIDFEYGSWSGGGRMKCKRIYPPSGRPEYRFKVTVTGYEEVKLEPVPLQDDQEVVLHVYLTRK